MKHRQIALAGMAAGAAAGVAWYVAHRLTAVGAVEPLRLGETFPTLRGTTLAGEAVAVPDDVQGRVTLLILGFDYRARVEAARWMSHVSAHYGRHPEVAYYLVPVIGGLGRAMRQAIDTAMQRGTPAAEQSHVLTVYDDLRWLKKRLAVQGPPRPYLYVLGRTGRVAWQAAGGFSDAGAQALEIVLREQGLNPGATPA